uniref:SH2 domain-containing protein n=1 Tax=Ditylenchus dipsaci TaxID=166011 RepID=A0A915CW42_9BILA
MRGLLPAMKWSGQKSFGRLLNIAFKIIRQTSNAIVAKYVFLVRASSRSTSDSQTTDAKKSKRSSKTTTMALSVRLPRECSTDIDHYLIETASSDAHSIRLEGSPHTFSSLPLLLQHYCYNGEELQTKLSLPWAISSCQSIQGLQALALMGQDFWTSEVSRMPPCPSASTTTSPVQHNTRQLPMVMHNPMMSPRRAGSSANSSNCSTSPVGKPAQQQPLKMSRSVSSTGSGTDQMFRKAQASKVASIFHRGTSAAGWLNHAPSKEKQPYPSEKIKIKKPRASSTIRLSSSNSSDMTSSSAKVEPVKVAGQEQSTPTWYAANTTTRGGKDGQASPAFSESSTASTKRSQLQQQRHGLLKKSQSAYEDLRAKSVQQASQQDPSRHLPLNINVGRRSGSVKTQENHSSSLAQCDYFLPYVSNNAAGCKSQSEAMIWASFSPSSASQVSDNDRISTNYLFNVPKKGFARLKSTFKMPFSAGAHPPTKSKDDSDHHSLSSEVVLARQLAFRRTNTDLCAESVHRLVGYHSIGDSPPPTTSQKPQLRRGNADAQHQAIAVLHRHHRIHQKVAPVQQSLKPPSSFLPPTSGVREKALKSATLNQGDPIHRWREVGCTLIPPDGRQQMDDSAMRKCIDELRRKRMQTATASSTPANNTSAETLNESKLQDLYPNKSNQIILRSQPDQLAQHADRPLIADCDGKDQERDELMQKSRSVADSVRALTAKMGGNSRNNTGELQTINEGLMTPVVQSPENSVQTTTTLVLHLGSSPEDKSQDKQNSKLLQHQQPEKNEQEETSTSTCHAFHNPNCNTRNHREVAVVGASELEEEQVTAIIKPALGPLNNSSRASKIAVATVRPQQHNNRPAAMESEDLQHQHIVCDIVVDKPGGRCSTTSVNNQQRSPTEEPPPKRQSEYAQLSELVQYFEDSSCSDPFKMKSSTLEVPCNIDEDAVSIAGTDFNEPWDSNAWDNLLDLARFGDEKPSTANAIRTLHSTDTIVEEDDLNTSAISADEEIQEGDHHHNPHHQHQTDVVVLRPRNGSSTCSMDKSNNNDGNNVEAGGRKFKLLALNNYGYESESLADEEEEEQDEFEAFTNDIEASTSGSYDKDTAAKSDRLLSSKEAAAMAAVLASSGSCSGDGNVNWPFKAPTFGIAAWMKPREDGNSMKVPLVEQEDFKNGVVRSRHRVAVNSIAWSIHPLHGSLTDLEYLLYPQSYHQPGFATCITIIPRFSNTSDPSCILQKYVEYLAADESTMFWSTLHRFIECTIESEETDPSVVIRRVRQFLNGMKNYLVKNGELDLHGIIERERRSECQRVSQH